MPFKGTADAIFSMRQVQERHQGRNKKLNYAFVGGREMDLRKLGVDELHSYV